MKLVCLGGRVLSPVLLLVTAVLASGAPAAVKAWQDTISLPTYAEGPPDPNPDFSAFSVNDTPNYPYAVRNRPGEKRKHEEWRTLNLENEYLSCRILPDLGGHLYNCRDKITGREIFYANPVVKPGKEGLRGSFVAMGIESNFPAGHSRTSTSPVDFAYRENADGSASVIVGDIDRITGMQWRSEYILRPSTAVLEQRVTLYNRADARQPYYWWSNAAIELDDKKMRAIIPANIMLVHETADLIPWPAGPDGIDNSLIANHHVMHGYFAYGCREPFMAIYKPSSRSGVAHFSDGANGKKLWIWGTESDEFVKTELTDRFNSYVEIQGGLFQNQFIFEFLQPQEVRRLTEYWIPFRQMSGISRVTPDAAVLVERHKNDTGKATVSIEALVTKPQPAAKIEVVCGGRHVIDATRDLDPAKPFTGNAEVDATVPCTVRLLSAAGTPLIVHSERPYNSDVAGSTKPGSAGPQDWTFAENEAQLIQRGTSYELDERLRFAWNDYNAALQKNPRNSEVHKHIARVAIMLIRPEDAVKHGAAALVMNPLDEEAAYYLGIGHAMLEHPVDAIAAFRNVRPGSVFYYPAQIQVAQSESRSGNVKAALEAIARATKDESGRSRAGAIEVALLRRAGQKDAAGTRLAHWLTIDPTDSLLRFERFLLGGKDDGLWAHLASDPEWILNIADEYISLGDFDSALVALTHAYPSIPANQQEAGGAAPDQHALIAYYRAWCRAKTGANAAGDWKTAANMSPRYIFPSRFTSYAVLQAALAQNPQDAVAYYLLGSLHMFSLRMDDAIADWQKALAINPQMEGLHRNLGRALLVTKDPVAAETILRAGTRIDKQNADITAALDEATSAMKSARGGKSSHAKVEQTALSAPAQQAVAAMMKAAAGAVDDALAAFRDPKLDAEQSVEVGQAYLEVQLQRTLSLARLAKCDAALSSLGGLAEKAPRPAARFVKYPHFQYYMALVEQKCGREKEARKRWAKIGPGRDRLPGAETVYPYLAGMKLDPELAKKDALSALRAVETELAKPENALHTWLLFARGALLLATGKEPEGIAVLKRAAATTTDPLAQYLAAVELNVNGAAGK